MSKFAILSDSTCDLNKQMREKYNIDYVPMNYIIDDVEYVASLDWEFHSSKDYYDLMRSGKRVTTTQVPQNVYYDKFKAYAEQGVDIIYIACSSALSSSVNTARIVAEKIKEEYADINIYCIDSLISSLGQAHMVITAAICRDEGRSAEETFNYIEGIKLCVNQCGTVESLEYLRRSGRVKASSAFFGNLFGVKPIIISNRAGENFAIKKVKGTINSRKEIAAHIKDAADGNYDTLYISHADCIEAAESLKDEILAIAPFKNVIIGTIGPIVGASVGPGTIISFCIGKEVMI